MPATAITTTYAGCRFRSRLEARWARFFDALGMPWQYEPQGFLLDGSTPYLPDFYLPSENLWVEVKGDRNALDYQLVLRATCELPSDPTGAAWEDPSRRGHVLLLLGDIPRDGLDQPIHSVTYFWKGDVWRDWAVFTASGIARRENDHTHCGSANTDWLGCDSYDLNLNLTPGLLDPLIVRNVTCDPLVNIAYTYARCARFEHGERG